MRVAILTTSYPRYPGDPSGHFVETESLRGARDGVEVHVLAPGDRLHHGGDGHLTVWPMGGVGLFGHPGALERLRAHPLRVAEFAPFAYRVLTRLRALGRMDRLVAHFLVPSGWPLATLARGRGHDGEIDVVSHGSDVRLLGRMPARLRQAWVRSLVDAGVRFRFVSAALRRELMQGLPDELAQRIAQTSSIDLPALLLPRPIPPPGSGLPDRDAAYVRAWLARRAEVGARQPVLWVMVCRLIPAKKVDLGLRLAAQHRAILWIVGDGPERGMLEELGRALGVHAHFFGQLPRDATLALMGCADRLVHLSEAEGAPTVVREARALGVPVLARPVGDLRAWAAEDPGISLADDLASAVPSGLSTP